MSAPNKRFLSNLNWLMQRHGELAKVYKDEWVAALEGEILSHGKNLAEVEKKAIDTKPNQNEEIAIAFIDCGKHLYGF